MAWTVDTNDGVEWGDITELDGAEKVIWSFHANFVTPLLNNGVFLSRGGTINGTTGFNFRSFSDPILRIGIRNGQNTYGRFLPALDGNSHHYLIAYDGPQAANVDKLRMWEDEIALTAVSYVGLLPTSMASQAGDPFIFGRFSSGMAGTFAEVYLWVGIANPSATFINTARKGCANLLLPGNLELDTGLLTDPPVDRSSNNRTPVVLGSPTVVAHPTDVQNRNSCSEGGGYMAASYFGQVEPPSGW